MTNVLKTLEYIQDNNLHGLGLSPPPGFSRGYDFYGKNLPRLFEFSANAYQHSHRRLPNLINPTTFTEKQVLFKFFGLVPITVSPPDKLRSAGYLPKEIRHLAKVPKRIWISDTAMLPDSEAVPNGTYYLKSNHGWGRQMPITLPVDESEKLAINAKLVKWLKKPHGQRLGLWWYETVKRNVFLEEDLRLDDGDAPDWKFFVCNGKVILLQLDTGRQTNHHQNLYERDGTPIDGEMYFKKGQARVMPDFLPQMIEIAEGNGSNFDFIRVDLFTKGDTIYLGEITLVPNGATLPIKSPELDKRLGDEWHAPWLGAVGEDWGGHYQHVRYDPWVE